MRPCSSYVPSPASNSSATATSSPGRTTRSCCSILGRRAMPGARFNGLGVTLDPKEGHGDVHTLLPVELKRVRDRERELQAVRDDAALRADLRVDPLLRLRVVERVHDAPDLQGVLEERFVRVFLLRAERRILEDRVHGLWEVENVDREEAQVHAERPRVLHRDPEGVLVQVERDHLEGPEQLCPDPEYARAASRVEHDAALDVPLPVGEIEDFGGNRRGGLVLLEGGLRPRVSIDLLKEHLEFALFQGGCGTEPL